MLITRRLFVAVPLSDRLQKRLESEISRFKDFPIILTRKGNFHVTLLFLGFIMEEEIPRIIESLEDAVIDIEPFEIDLSEMRSEPEGEHPTMVWFAGEPSDALTNLRNVVADALEYLTPASKSFRPHVTLAKIRRGKYEALEEKPDFTKILHVIEPVDSITLFESTTENGKRVYLPLAEIPFGGEGGE
ncbi:MAG: RNA 2',3'-cyclic phosphodiesterase [Undibacterium sp.]